MKRNVRESNIELLRILAMLGVIILHFNNPKIGGGLQYVDCNSFNYYILYFLESVCICSVNLFVLISGFFLSEKNTRYLIKPIKLIVEVVFFQSAIYIMDVLCGTVEFSFRQVLISLIPNNYFVILYIVLYMISPYLNVIIRGLSLNQLKKMVFLIFMIFSVWTTFVDVLEEIAGREILGLSPVGLYGSQYGYTIVNFILMYFVGAWLKREEITNKFYKYLPLCLIFTIMLIIIWAMYNNKIGFSIERSAWEYCNPFVIVETVFIFLFFMKLKINVNIIINKLAEASFTVYLLHIFFVENLSVKEFVRGNPFYMISYILASSIIIYLICWLIFICYQRIMIPILDLCLKNIRTFKIDF